MEQQSTPWAAKQAAHRASELFRLERRGLEVVPESARHGRPRDLFFIWAAALADFFSFLAGAVLISLGLGVIDAAVVLAAGAMAGAVALGLLSTTGPRTGLPQIVVSRLAFGRYGASIGGLLTVLIAIGWFSYDCAIAVNTATALPQFGGGSPAAGLQLTLLGAMVMGCVLVAMLGHRTITWFQTIQAPMFMGLCLVITAFLWSHFHLGLTSGLSGGAHLAVALFGFTATFALIVSWATYAADYSRYLPSGSRPVRVALGSGAGSLLTLVACGLLGIAVQSIDPGRDLSQLPALIVGNVPQWLGWTFVVFIIVAEMSSNYLNAYTAALSSLAIGIPLRRWQAVLVMGLLGGGFAAWVLLHGDFQSTYLNFLTATYIWFPAWSVVVLLDFRRHRRVDPDALLRRPSRWQEGWHWPAMTALGLGSLATLAFYNTIASAAPGAAPFWVGWGARHLLAGSAADISSVVGLTATVLIFLTLQVLTRRHRDVAA